MKQNIFDSNLLEPLLFLKNFHTARSSSVLQGYSRLGPRCGSSKVMQVVVDVRQLVFVDESLDRRSERQRTSSMKKLAWFPVVTIFHLSRSLAFFKPRNFPNLCWWTKWLGLFLVSQTCYNRYSYFVTIDCHARMLRLIIFLNLFLCGIKTWIILQVKVFMVDRGCKMRVVGFHWRVVDGWVTIKNKK